MKFFRIFALVCVTAVGCRVMAEKQSFNPDAMFCIELDSLLPADQESHSGDTNYVQCVIKGKPGRVSLRVFRGFLPISVSTGAKGEVEEVEAIRVKDIPHTRLPALFKAMGDYFAGFDGIVPAGGSDTNMTWAGVTKDGRTYVIDVYKKYDRPSGMVAVWMTLRSDLARCNAELRAARIAKQRTALAAADYRMMQEKAYEGVWGYSDRRLHLRLCFIKGGLGLAEYQERCCPFYWSSDERGNVSGTVAIGGGLLSKMAARYVPERNAFKVRLEYPDDKEFLEKLSDAYGEGEDGAIASGRLKEAMAEALVKYIAGKNMEGKMREFLKLSLGANDIPGSLTNTVSQEINVGDFNLGLKSTMTKSLDSFADFPVFPEAGKRGCLTLKGMGVCKLMIAAEENGDAIVCVTIGEMSRRDVNAPSYAWLELANPRVKSATEFSSRASNGLPDDACEKIAKVAAEFGVDVEEQVMEQDMFWHYRREDQLHIRFPKGKSGSIAAFVKKALDGVLEFPVEMKVY